ARCSKGADFTERVPGEVLRLGMAEALVARDRGAIDRGLGIRRALGHVLERVLADQLGGEIEQVGAKAGDELATRGVSRPLAGKEDRRSAVSVHARITNPELGSGEGHPPPGHPFGGVPGDGWGWVCLLPASQTELLGLSGGLGAVPYAELSVEGGGVVL